MPCHLLHAIWNFIQAYKCYIEALRIQPTFAIAWSNLAGLFMEAGDLNRALVYYKVELSYKLKFDVFGLKSPFCCHVQIL